MKDRIPTKPGRVQLVPSPDGDDLFIFTRADEPSQVGTPLNKASLLSDATAALMGLTQEDPTVDDALASVGGRFSFVRSGTTPPDFTTEGKRGDIYILDDGGVYRRIYICDLDGARSLPLKTDFYRGGFTLSTGINDSVTYRVRCDCTLLTKGAKLSIASGFRFGLTRLNENGEYVSHVNLRTSDYTIPEDMYARILIARVTENTSESADPDTFSEALTYSASGRFWTQVCRAKETRKTSVITTSSRWTVPDDLHGTVTVRIFGGGAGGYGGYGGGGGEMAVWTGELTKRFYDIFIGAGGYAGQGGILSSFGDLVTANGASGASGGTGGGKGRAGNSSPPTGYSTTINGSYGGGGGSGHYLTTGGSGGIYGGGGGGGYGSYNGGYSGGSGKSGAYSGGSGYGASAENSHGGGGGGYKQAGKNASSSSGGAGGNGVETYGLGLDFEGPGTGGAAGTCGGGGGGYGGEGGTGTYGGAGGGGGYGAKGGDGSSGSYQYGAGGGGGGYGGEGGNGTSGMGSMSFGGGGGGYGLSGKGGSGNARDGGYAAGGSGGWYGTPAEGYATGGRGGNGICIIQYTGYEVAL